MKMSQWCSLQDRLAKLDAETRLRGGTQYTPDVALAVGGSNKAKAMMRLEKHRPRETMPLKMLME